MIEVAFCDFCNKETPESHLSPCAICKREMCNEDGGKEHTAYAVDVYRYGGAERVNGAHICNDCASKSLPVATIQVFLDSLLGR